MINDSEWKDILKITFTQFKVIIKIPNVCDFLYDLFKRILNVITDFITRVWDRLKIAFNTVKVYLEKSIKLKVRKSYPHYVNNFVNNFYPKKYTSKGFPNKIMCRARSRC